MSGSKPTGTDPQASSFANLSISKDNAGTSSDKPAASEADSKFNWADDATTPVSESNKQPGLSKSGEATSNGQLDGATGWLGGTSGLDEPEFDVNVKLADLQDDPNNPLYSAKTFEELNLHQDLLRGLSVMNFRKPSKIQERALPLLLKNPPQNLIGQSQSGTGKTAAFVLNMLSRVDLASVKPQCMVLAPTRELARQIASVAKIMGTFINDLQVTEAIPNPAARGQEITGQVVVGTPGTVMDMTKRRLLDVKNIKVLTLDEADNMLDIQGMADQCKRVKNSLSKNCQIVLFSATFPSQVLEFAATFAPKANQLTLEVEKLTVKGIKQMYLDCSSDEEKYTTLVKFYTLMTIASSIIFVKRRDTATEIEKRMTSEGHAVASLTGGLDPEERDKVFSRFRSGEAKVLITTNVLSRGIDVKTVTLVINYDIPETVDHQPDYETYLHRIGRTGRFGRTGAALSFVHDRKSWQMLMAICKHFQVEPTKLETSDWDETEKLLKRIMQNSRNDISEANMTG